MKSKLIFFSKTQHTQILHHNTFPHFFKVKIKWKKRKTTQTKCIGLIFDQICRQQIKGRCKKFDNLPQVNLVSDKILVSNSSAYCYLTSYAKLPFIIAWILKQIFVCILSWKVNKCDTILKRKIQVFFLNYDSPSSSIASCVRTGMVTWCLHLTQPCCVPLWQVLIWVLSPDWFEELCQLGFLIPK